MSVDTPLPPATADMRNATSEHFMHETPESFQPYLGGDIFDLRETDIGRLSGGAVGARVFRAGSAESHGTPWHWHEWGMQVGYITKGWAIYEFEGVGKVRVEAGTFLYQLPMNRHRELESSPDFEGIEITFPANTKSTFLIPDEEKGGFNEMVVGG